MFFFLRSLSLSRPRKWNVTICWESGTRTKWKKAKEWKKRKNEKRGEKREYNMKEESTWASPSPIWCLKWFEYGCVCGAWLVNCNSKRRYFERLFITFAFNLRVHTFKLLSIFGWYSIMRVRCCELTNAGRERERKMVGVKWRISSIIYIRYIIRFVCCNMLQHEKDECMTSLILWRARFAITNDTLSGAKREREREESR